MYLNNARKDKFTNYCFNTFLAFNSTNIQRLPVFILNVPMCARVYACVDIRVCAQLRMGVSARTI